MTTPTGCSRRNGEGKGKSTLRGDSLDERTCIVELGLEKKSKRSR